MQTGGTAPTPTARRPVTATCTRPSGKRTTQNRGKLYRRRAAGEFDPDRYGRRGTIKAVFGAAAAAAETADHRPYCRYRKPETQARSGSTSAICMNVGTLNRIRRAAELARQPAAVGGKSRTKSRVCGKRIAARRICVTTPVSTDGPDSKGPRITCPSKMHAPTPAVCRDARCAA